MAGTDRLSFAWDDVREEPDQAVFSLLLLGLSEHESVSGQPDLDRVHSSWRESG